MISVEKAWSLVAQHVQRTSKTESRSIDEALGYVLAQDITSPLNLPPFRQSAMDGYAICTAHASSYTVIDEVKAGDKSHPTLMPGQAVRIFTGAAVPDSADAVIMQEKVILENQKVIINDPIKPGGNIRPIGEQINQGTLALQAGTYIRASTIGFLGSLGISSVSVFTKPSVAVIVTGSELVGPDVTLERGQVYESNSNMLKAGLASLHIADVQTYQVTDDYQQTETLLRRVVSDHDLTLISGGISVGDYDFVGKALHAIGVKEIFYKVKQKPGKPLFFGKKEGQYVFALPGNPASSLACFYAYVELAISLFSGFLESTLLWQELKVQQAYTKKDDRAHFLKASVANDTVKILGGQASSMLQSFAVSDALIYLPEEITEIKENSLVRVLRLPQ